MNLKYYFLILPFIFMIDTQVGFGQTPTANKQPTSKAPIKKVTQNPSIKVSNVLQTVPQNKVWRVVKIIQQNCEPSQLFNQYALARFGTTIGLIINSEEYPCYIDENNSIVTMQHDYDTNETYYREVILPPGTTIKTRCEGDIILIQQKSK